MVQLASLITGSRFLAIYFVCLVLNGWGTLVAGLEECECASDAFVPLIFGGEDAPEGRFPYACSLRSLSKDDHFCGCVLVDEQHVLTAAHCVDPEIEDADPSPLVSIGLYKRDNSDDSAEEFGLDKKPVIHPEWNGRVEDGHDIAVLKLSEKCKKMPIDLPAPESDYRSGMLFLAIGFGDTDEKERIKLADTLQILSDLTFVSRSSCNSFQPYSGNIESSMFCAFSNKGSISRGDSGGPVFIPHRFNDISSGKSNLDRLVGLISFGPKDQNTSFPEVFTKVSSFRTWIDCVVKGGDADKCTRPSRPDTVEGGGSRSEVPVLNTDEVIRAPLANKDPECLLSYGRESKSLEDRKTTCLGGTAMTTPKCLFWNETGEVDCFYRGADSSIHRMTIKDSVVEGIENIGGTALGDVECVITGPRSLSCFIVSEDSALWTRELKNGKWKDWYSLGGALQEVPRCVSFDGQIDCVGRTLNYSMYHKSYHEGDFQWRDFRNLLGYTRERPTVVYEPDNGIITIYFEEWDHSPYYEIYNIEDDIWLSGDDIFSQEWYSPLSIVNWSNLTFYFSLGYTNEVIYFGYVKEKDPDDEYFWTEHVTLESPVGSRPECLSVKDFTVDCFVLGTDNILRHRGLRHPGGLWSNWKTIVGPFIEAPTCFAMSKTQIRCYVRSYTLSLAEVVFDID